ncbi:MAG: hypothetical protein V1789_08465 [PVC group bacterium]
MSSAGKSYIRHIPDGSVRELSATGGPPATTDFSLLWKMGGRTPATRTSPPAPSPRSWGG